MRKPIPVRALAAALAALCLFASCAVQTRPVYRKNGKEYGVTGGLIWRENWWNHYRRGASYASGDYWPEAIEDFQVAIRMRAADQRRARTYGMHFLDYFPHRELGVVFFRQGRFAEAAAELEQSLRSEESAKAEYFLNKARRSLLEESGADGSPPEVLLSWPPDGHLTRDLRVEFRGVVRDDQFAAGVSIQGRKVPVFLARPEIPFRLEVPLDPGENRVVVAGRDLLGKESRREVTVRVDRAGPVLYLDPVGRAPRTGADAVTIAGEVDDRFGLARLSINGRSILPVSGSLLRFEERVPLSPDQETLAIEAEDRAGNVTRAEVAVRGEAAADPREENADGLPLAAPRTVPGETATLRTAREVDPPREFTDRSRPKPCRYRPAGPDAVFSSWRGDWFAMPLRDRADPSILMTWEARLNCLDDPLSLASPTNEPRGSDSPYSLPRLAMVGDPLPAWTLFAAPATTGHVEARHPRVASLSRPGAETEGPAELAIHLKDLPDSVTVYYESLLLEGSVTGPAPVRSLQVDGQELLDRKGRNIFFSCLVGLEEGTNRVLIQALDREDRDARREITVVRRVPRLHEASSRLRLCLLPFRPEGCAPERGRLIGENLLVALIGQNRFDMVERELLDKVLAELRLADTRLTEEKTAARTGRLLAAEGSVMGAVVEGPRAIETVASVVDTETSAILLTRDAFSEDKSLAALQDLAEGLSYKLRQGLPLLEGNVVRREGDSCFLDLGARDGLLAGQKVLFFREGPEIRHPTTQMLLGRDWEVVAEGRVESVQEDISTVDAVKARDKAEIRDTDLVRTK